MLAPKRAVAIGNDREVILQDLLLASERSDHFPAVERDALDLLDGSRQFFALGRVLGARVVSSVASLLLGDRHEYGIVALVPCLAIPGQRS